MELTYWQEQTLNEMVQQKRSERKILETVLNDKQMQVLKLYQKGYSNTEIYKKTYIREQELKEILQTIEDIANAIRTKIKERKKLEANQKLDRKLLEKKQYLDEQTEFSKDLKDMKTESKEINIKQDINEIEVIHNNIKDNKKVHQNALENVHTASTQQKNTTIYNNHINYMKLKGQLDEFRKRYRKGQISKKCAEANLEKLTKCILYLGNNFKNRMFLVDVLCYIEDFLTAEQIINEYYNNYEPCTDEEKEQLKDIEKRVIIRRNTVFIKKLYNSGMKIEDIYASAEKERIKYREQLSFSFIKSILNDCRKEKESKKSYNIER